MLRRRDVGVLVVSVCGIFLALQSSHDYNLKLSWYMEVDTSHYHNGIFPDVHERLYARPVIASCVRVRMRSELSVWMCRPLPLVTDLDGDGLNEIVVCTRDAKLRILSAPNATSASLRASQSNMCVLLRCN